MTRYALFIATSLAVIVASASGGFADASWRVSDMTMMAGRVRKGWREVRSG